LVWDALGYHASALKYFREALQEAESINYDYEGCNVYVNMGYALLAIKKYEESMNCFSKALEIAMRVQRDDIIWEAYFGLGQCLEKYGQYNSALAYYGKSIETIDRMTGRLALDIYKVGFLRDKMRAFEFLLNLLWNLREKEKTSRYDLKIVEIVEKAKARAFLEELGSVDRSTLELSSKKFRNEQLSLSKKISLIISELVRSDLEDIQRQKLLTRLQVEEDKYTNLLNRTKTEQAEHSGIAPPAVISSDRIQERYLDGRSAFLEYYLGEKRSFGIFISRDHFILKVLPPRATIEDSLRAFLKMISTPPERNFQGALAGRRIYKELVYPFEAGLSKSIEHLIFVPDGVLHYLPFEALVRDDFKKAEPKYLVELFDISYATSISSLAYLMDKGRSRDSKKTLLAVGNPVYVPGNGKILKRRDKQEETLREIYLNEGFELSALPHSKKEVRGITRCFQDDKVDVLLEADAKEEDVKTRSLEDYRLIHFACHGFLDEKTPMRSALVLALDDDSEEDGFLQAREISNLRLNADLVVLSACQTGKGRLESAEGVLGLPRSFFYAGARSTISSLWKINDKSTSKIMPDFYRYLAAGNNTARSLRLAKLKMLQSRFSHPFYWAAFVLNGDYLSAGR
jgi:CHAT domain-containing protein